MMFFGYLIEDVASKFQGWWLLCLAAEKPYVNPAIQVHLNSKTMILGRHAISLAQKLIAKTKHLSATFLVRYSKKHRFEIFGKAISSLRHPNVPFQGWKSWREYVNVFEFCNGQRLVRPLQYQQKIITQDVLYMPCARDVHSRWAAPRLQQSAGSPSNFSLSAHRNWFFFLFVSVATFECHATGTISAELPTPQTILTFLAKGTIFHINCRRWVPWGTRRQQQSGLWLYNSVVGFGFVWHCCLASIESVKTCPSTVHQPFLLTISSSWWLFMMFVIVYDTFLHSSFRVDLRIWCALKLLFFSNSL